MSKRTGLFALAALMAAAPALPGAALAQTTAPAPATSNPATSTPAPSTSAVPPAGTVATTTSNPNLSVATIRLENGTRLSKIIGASVTNGQSDTIGTVDDVVMTGGDKVTMAIISVGGFLGLGSKLVSVPWSDLQMANGKIALPGASKDSLNGLPSFQY